MDIHRPIPASDRLAEQSLNLLGDSRNDRVVEDEGQGRQKQGAQYHGDDDFDSIGDVEIPALVGKGHMRPNSQMIDLIANGLGQLVHKITSYWL